MCKNQCSGQCENCSANTFEIQILEVKKWAETKNFHLFNVAQVRSQTDKLIEEANEVFDATNEFLADNNDQNTQELKKEIGDVLVVAIILCQKLGFDLLECLAMAHKKNASRLSIQFGNQIVKREDLIAMVGEQEADRLIKESLKQ